MLGILALATLWSHGQNSAGIDFYQFWVVGQVLNRGGGAEIYTDSAQVGIGQEFYQKTLTLSVNDPQRQAAVTRETLQIYSTPALYSVFRLFASGDYQRDKTLYLFVSFCSTVLSFVLLCRMLRFSSLMLPLAFTVVGHAFGAAAGDLRVGNVNQIQLGLLTIFLWLHAETRWRESTRGFAAGVLLGCIVMFKPNTALVALFVGISHLFNGNFRVLAAEAGGALVGMLNSFGLSSLSFGSTGCWPAWLTQIQSLMSDTSHSIQYGNYSLANLIEELSGTGVTIPLLTFSTGAAVACLWIGRSRSGPVSGAEDELRDRRHDLRAIFVPTGLGIAVMLLTSKVAWMHYFLLLAPFILYVMRPVMTRPNRRELRRIRIRRTLCLVAVALMTNLPVVLPGFLQGDLAHAGLACSSALIFYCLGLWEAIETGL